MILAGPRLWPRNSLPLAARGETGSGPYLLRRALLLRKQPISTNPRIEERKPCQLRDGGRQVVLVLIPSIVVSQAIVHLLHVSRSPCYPIWSRLI
jgi:hypothetical protein